MFPLKNICDQEKPLLLKKSRQNLKSPFNSITYTGEAFDVLKSSLQKSIRRCDYETVMWCIRETHLLYNLDDSNKLYSKARIVNILNRIACCAIEDVSSRDVIALSYFFTYLSEYKLGQFSEILHLARAAETLRRALKSRACSHLETVASNIIPEKQEHYNNEFISAFKKGLRWEAAHYLGAIYREFMGLTENDPVSSKPLDKIASRKKAFLKWFYPVIKEEYRQIKLPCIIQDFKNSIRFRLEFFKERLYFKEQFKILISIIESIIAFKTQEMEKICETSLSSALEVSQIKENNSSFIWLEHHNAISHPKYVYDLHTSTGDDSIKMFIEEGSLVENPDTLWINSEWKTKYEAIKIMNYTKQKKVNNKRSHSEPSVF